VNTTSLASSLAQHNLVAAATHLFPQITTSVSLGAFRTDGVQVYQTISVAKTIHSPSSQRLWS